MPKGKAVRDFHSVKKALHGGEGMVGTTKIEDVQKHNRQRLRIEGKENRNRSLHYHP